MHINCRCKIKNISAVFAGFTTQDGFNGADYVVKLTSVPPSNYITKQHVKNWFFFYQDYDGKADKPYWIA